ncbi:hypothetical protein AHAS_Ahas19G0222700 [Arachis hypogaea]
MSSWPALGTGMHYLVCAYELPVNYLFPFPNCLYYLLVVYIFVPGVSVFVLFLFHDNLETKTLGSLFTLLRTLGSHPYFLSFPPPQMGLVEEFYEFCLILRDEDPTRDRVFIWSTLWTRLYVSYEPEFHVSV